MGAINLTGSLLIEYFEGSPSVNNTYVTMTSLNTLTQINGYFSTLSTKTFKITGYFTNSLTASISPQIQFSAAPGGTNSVLVGSYIKFKPIYNLYNKIGTWT